jgi:hypothetical protein
MRLSRRPNDEGASLVEVGLIIPLLLLLAIGLAEIGFLAIDYMTVSNAARSGARTGSTAADHPLADTTILEVVEEDACNLRYGDLESVTIFEADPIDGSIPDPPGSLVNIYTPSGALQCGAAGHVLVCANGCPWDPATLRDNVPPTMDAVGVEVAFSHSTITGLFPLPTVTWSEIAVMQLEPDTRG